MEARDGTGARARGTGRRQDRRHGKELIYIGHNGQVLQIEPNGALALQLVVNNEPRDEGNWRFAAAFLNADGSPKFDQAALLTVAAKTGDDKLFQTYTDSGARKGRNSTATTKEAQAVWDLFRSLTEGKPLKDCTRDDGRLLVKHYTAEGLSNPSMQKKIMWLTAMVEFSIVEAKLSMLNPFSGIVPQSRHKRSKSENASRSTTRTLRRARLSSARSARAINCCSGFWRLRECA